jgi:sortase (surface protein transpeptidase)
MELRPVAKRARRLYLNSPELLQQVPRRGLLSQQRRDFALESVRDLREERMPKSVSTGKQNSSVNVTISQSDRTVSVKSESTKKPKKLAVGKIIKTGASVTLVIGAIFLGMGIQSRQQVASRSFGQTLGTQTNSANSNEDEQIPDESQVADKELRSYQVASTMPRIIEISKIKIKSRVLRVSQTKSGAVGVPSNIFDTAWYENTVLPGQLGSSLIVGHNHGPTTEGVFWNLAKLSKGDLIKITYGSGEQKSFKAVSVENKKVQDIDMAKILASPDSNAKLFLMSCSGKYDKTTDSYLNRTVVESNWVQ